MRALMTVLLASTVSASIANADFTLLPSTPAAQSAPSESTGSKLKGPTEQQLRPRQPHLVIARGFGDQVPLAFAVRQIVPAAVKVHFAQGVDQTTPVNWKGGRPWNAVLWSAIHPLGLHLVLKDGAAWITN